MIDRSLDSKSQTRASKYTIIQEYLDAIKVIALDDIFKGVHMRKLIDLKYQSMHNPFYRIIFQFSPIKSADDLTLRQEKGIEIEFTGDVPVQKIKLNGILQHVMWYIPHVAEIALVNYINRHLILRE